MAGSFTTLQVAILCMETHPGLLHSTHGVWMRAWAAPLVFRMMMAVPLLLAKRPAWRRQGEQIPLDR